MKLNNNILIQACSTTYQGGRDQCLCELDGKTLLQHTIEHFNSPVTIIAPEYDQGNLDFIIDKFPEGMITIYYSHDANPLQRMIDATKDLNDDEYIIRVNGRNFCMDEEQMVYNYELAIFLQHDCVRFPENFPGLFTSDIYRVGALRNIPITDPRFLIHPKYAINSHISVPNLTRYTDKLLTDKRNQYERAYLAERTEVNGKSIKSADMMSFHYELVKKHGVHYNNLIDIGCGDGHGINTLTEIADNITAIDYDAEIIDTAKSKYSKDNVTFLKGDAESLEFDDNTFDCITAFEILEHVDPDKLLKGMKRILKKDGMIFISTPQTMLGRIPLLKCHLIEFSLDEIKALVSKYFEIDKVIGLKQGTIYFDNDEVGSCSYIMARGKNEINS